MNVLHQFGRQHSRSNPVGALRGLSLAFVMHGSFPDADDLHQQLQVLGHHSPRWQEDSEPAFTPESCSRIARPAHTVVKSQALIPVPVLRRLQSWHPQDAIHLLRLFLTEIYMLENCHFILFLRFQETSHSWTIQSIWNRQFDHIIINMMCHFVITDQVSFVQV